MMRIMQPPSTYLVLSSGGAFRFRKPYTRRRTCWEPRFGHRPFIGLISLRSFHGLRMRGGILLQRRALLEAELDVSKLRFRFVQLPQDPLRLGVAVIEGEVKRAAGRPA